MLRALPLATLLLASSALSVQAATAPVAQASAPASAETAPVTARLVTPASTRATRLA